MEIKVPGLSNIEEEKISFDAKSSTLSSKLPDTELKNLAIAIIQQAVSEACSTPENDEEKGYKNDALYFLRDSPGFDYWCQHANISSQWFREQLNPILNDPDACEKLSVKLSRMHLLIRGR